MSDPSVFDQKRSAGYDRRIRTVIPGYESLHQTSADVLGEALPEQARVLIAGAGTGKELVVLGGLFSGWRFTAADPSGPMLEVLRGRARESGLESRVTVRTSLVKDLPAEDSGFDGATSLLISHFITDQEARTAYFRSIAQRLKPGAPMAFADHHGDRSDPGYKRLQSAWKGRCLRSDMPRQEVDDLFARMETDIAIIPEERLLSLVEAAGFERPLPFWRGLTFGAWVARRRL